MDNGDLKLPYAKWWPFCGGRGGVGGGISGIVKKDLKGENSVVYVEVMGVPFVSQAWSFLPYCVRSSWCVNACNSIKNNRMQWLLTQETAMGCVIDGWLWAYISRQWLTTILNIIFFIVTSVCLAIVTRWSTMRRDIMAAIFQTTFSNTFSWMKIFTFLSKYHRNLILRVRLTRWQHWFR